MKLSYDNYLEECEFAKSLPKDKSIPNLSYLVNKGIGVDFESYNPTAYGFWSKYFEIYTNSLTRRIDECGID